MKNHVTEKQDSRDGTVTIQCGCPPSHWGGTMDSQVESTGTHKPVAYIFSKDLVKVSQLRIRGPVLIIRLLPAGIFTSTFQREPFSSCLFTRSCIWTLEDMH